MEKIEKRTTGIGGLDFALDGGFPIGSSIIAYGSPKTGIDLMAKQFWKSESGAEKNSYFVLDQDPETDMIDIRDDSIKLSDIGKQMKGDRIIIDSLSSLIQKYKIKPVLTFIKDEVRTQLDRGANVLFTLYPGMQERDEEVLVMRATDIFVELREQILGNEIERTFVIYRLKGMATPQRVIPYLITEKGLELSTTTRVV